MDLLHNIPFFVRVLCIHKRGLHETWRCEIQIVSCCDWMYLSLYSKDIDITTKGSSFHLDAQQSVQRPCLQKACITTWSHYLESEKGNICAQHISMIIHSKIWDVPNLGLIINLHSMHDIITKSMVRTCEWGKMKKHYWCVYFATIPKSCLTEGEFYSTRILSATERIKLVHIPWVWKCYYLIT